MWEQYFQLPGFTARTSLLSTTAKFAQSERGDMTDGARMLEIKAFVDRMKEPGFIEQWNADVAQRVRLNSVQSLLRIAVLESALLREGLLRAAFGAA
jgi:hypothetical protein